MWGKGIEAVPTFFVSVANLSDSAVELRAVSTTGGCEDHWAYANAKKDLTIVSYSERIKYPNNAWHYTWELPTTCTWQIQVLYQGYGEGGITVNQTDTILVGGVGASKTRNYAFINNPCDGTYHLVQQD